MTDASPGSGELNLLGLRLPWRDTVVIGVTTFALLLDYYHNFAIPDDPLLSQGIDRPVLFLLVPILTLLLLGKRPSDYGLRLGDWRLGLGLAVAACAVLTPIILWLASQPDFQAYYAKPDYDLRTLQLSFGADVAASEFLFRGFLMWTLIRLAGPSGVVLATMPFVFTHITKPEIETLTTFFGGLAFGWLAWRTRSVLYGALVHVYLIDLLLQATAH
jgi:membrane protease YdiL (CAAX protease family)